MGLWLLLDEGEFLSKPKRLETRINTGFLAHFRVEKRSKYMKATGIVRRIEEYGIIGQKSKKPHKHYGFR